MIKLRVDKKIANQKKVKEYIKKCINEINKNFTPEILMALRDDLLLGEAILKIDKNGKIRHIDPKEYLNPKPRKERKQKDCL